MGMHLLTVHGQEHIHHVIEAKLTPSAHNVSCSVKSFEGIIHQKFFSIITAIEEILHYCSLQKLHAIACLIIFWCAMKWISDDVAETFIEYSHSSPWDPHIVVPCSNTIIRPRDFALQSLARESQLSEFKAKIKAWLQFKSMPIAPVNPKLKSNSFLGARQGAVPRKSLHLFSWFCCNNLMANCSHIYGIWKTSFLNYFYNSTDN